MMISTTDLEKKNRLIVVVPDYLVGNIGLAQKIFWTALRERCDVLYLTLVDGDGERLSVNSRLTTMKAVTAGNCVVVHSILAKTDDWLNTLRELYLPGDRIVCQEEQAVENGFLKTVPMPEFLRDALDVPVISLSGFYHPQQEQASQWFRNIIAWLGFLLIIIGFTMLEIQLDPLLQSAAGKMILCIVVTFELGAIWVWNRMTI